MHATVLTADTAPAEPPAPDRMAARPAARTEWADIAKAMSVLLIVLTHVNEHFREIGITVSVMNGVTSMLTPVRLPLFFLISGIFAVRLFADSRDRLVSRVADLLKVYVIWGVLCSAFVATMLPADHVQRTQIENADLLAMLLLPNPPFPWFLWALAVFNVLAAIGTRHAPRATLVLAVILAFAIDLIPYDLPGTDTVAGVGFYKNFLFFVLPFYFTGIRERIERLPALTAAPLTGIAYCGILFVEPSFSGQWFHPLLTVGASLLGVVCLMCIARMMEGTGAVRKVMLAAGMKTLPIYVMHGPMVLWLTIAAKSLGLYGNLAADVLVAIAIAALAATACVLAERAMPEAMRSFFLIPRRPKPQNTAAPAP